MLLSSVQFVAEFCHTLCHLQDRRGAGGRGRGRRATGAAFRARWAHGQDLGAVVEPQREVGGGQRGGGQRAADLGGGREHILRRQRQQRQQPVVPVHIRRRHQLLP